MAGQLRTDRLISINPVAKLPLPKIEHQEMRFLTSEEVWQVAEAIDRRYRSFVLLAGFSGLRLGELLGLRWASVDMERRRVRVADTLVDIEAKIHFGPPKTEGESPFRAAAVVRLRGARGQRNR